MKFRPLMQGMFNAISVNNRLRELHRRIDALEAQKGTETPVIHAPAQEPTTTANSADTVTFDSFNWQESDDAQGMKAFAKDTFGLEIKGNKKPDTVRAEIQAYIDTLTEA